MRWLVLLLVTLFCYHRAAAACSSPTGSQGELRWITSAVYACDGTNWVSTAVTTTATACSTTGEVKYASSVMSYCNGSVLVQMNGSTNGTCTAGQAGAYQYDTTGNRPQYCNGTNWIVMQGAPSIAFAQKTVVGANTSGTSWSLPPFGSPITAGSLIVCAIGAYSGAATITGVTDTQGNTYQRILTPKTFVDGFVQEVWYVQSAVGGASDVVKATYSSALAASTWVQGSCSEFTGAAPSSVLDQAAFTTGTTDTAAGNTLVTTSAKELLFVVTIENSVCSVASGWTDNTGSYGDLIEYKKVSTLGSYATPTGSGCGANWMMFSMSFRSQ